MLNTYSEQLYKFQNKNQALDIYTRICLLKMCLVLVHVNSRHVLIVVQNSSVPLFYLEHIILALGIVSQQLAIRLLYPSVW